MIVFDPSPWKPPQIPLTSRVGRAPIRSSVVKPASPTSDPRPECARHASSSNGRAANASRSAVGQADDVVVEARDADPPVRALERRDDLGERVGRVLDRPAERPRMEVDRRALDVDLDVRVAAQADRDRRQVALEEARVADDGHVRREAFAVRGQPLPQVPRVVLLVALEEVAHVDGQGPARRQEAGEGHDVEVDLALVVGRAASEHPVADDDGLERRRGPQVERVDRLHVVVAVDEDRGRVGAGMEPVRVDDRVAGRLLDGHVLGAGTFERSGEPGCRCTAVVTMLRQRRDARDPQERLVTLEALVAGRVEVVLEGRVGQGHGAMVAVRLIGW